MGFKVTFVSLLSLFALVVLTAVLVVFFMTMQGSSEVGRVVETKVGSIRGMSASDGDYDMFMGIPYAYVHEDNPFGVSTVFICRRFLRQWRSESKRPKQNAICIKFAM